MLSSPQPLSYCVPQGSVRGPTAFTKYSVSVGHIARKICISYSVYTDGTQLYVTFKAADQQTLKHPSNVYTRLCAGIEGLNDF